MNEQQPVGTTIQEALPAALYEKRIQTRSKIDPSVLLEYVAWLNCPKCKAQLRPLKHSEFIDCQCGLNIRLLGAALVCTLEVKDG